MINLVTKLHTNPSTTEMTNVILKNAFGKKELEKRQSTLS